MNNALFNKDVTALIACPGGYSGVFVIPENVTSIGNYAFHSCSNLSAIYFEGTGAEWDSVFKGINWNAGCPGNQTVIFLPSVVINKNAEGGTVTGAGWYQPGDTVTLSAVPAAGWRFVEWQVVSGGVTITDSQFTMPDGDVAILAVFEQIPVYSITGDGTAVATRYDGWLGAVVAAEAAEGEELSLQIAEGATPAAGQYFTGEFTVDGVSLGMQYDAENPLIFWPVTEFIMPDHSVRIGAVQALRQALTLDFARNGALTVPVALMDQLYDLDIVTFDDGGNEFISLNEGVTPDLAVTSPDGETTFDYTLTLLSGADATGTFTFSFTGSEDRYGRITFVMSMPTFGTADFTLPAGTVTIGESAFENDTQITAVNAGSVTSIGVNAFKGCTGLTKIRLPKNCSIAASAFDGCTALEAIFAPAGGTTEQWANSNGVLFVGE